MHRVVAWFRLAAAFALVGYLLLATRAGATLRNPALWALPQRPREWHLRHDAKVAEAKQRAGQVDLLFVGDSITQNYERTGPPEILNFRPVWDELFAPRRAMNLGFDGDRTGNVLWRLRHGEVDGLAPRDIVLLIGTNNLSSTRLQPQGETAEQTTAGILAVLDELHHRMPTARLLALPPLPTNFSAERRSKEIGISAALKAAVDGLPYARFLDVSDIFLDGARVVQDRYYDPLLTPGASALHPTAAAQRLMARAVVDALQRPKPPEEPSLLTQ